jgi:hypothetical protein
VAWDDDEEWPEPDRDPRAVERRQREIDAWRRRALRYAYAAVGILLIVVIVVALTR